MVKSAIHGPAAVNLSAPARLCPGRRVAYEAFKLQILCIKGPERVNTQLPSGTCFSLDQGLCPNQKSNQCTDIGKFNRRIDWVMLYALTNAIAPTEVLRDVITQKIDMSVVNSDVCASKNSDLKWEKLMRISIKLDGFCRGREDGFGALSELAWIHVCGVKRDACANALRRSTNGFNQLAWTTQREYNNV